MCEKYGQIAGQRDKAVRLPVRRLVSQAKSRQIFLGNLYFQRREYFYLKQRKCRILSVLYPSVDVRKYQGQEYVIPFPKQNRRYQFPFSWLGPSD